MPKWINLPLPLPEGEGHQQPTSPPEVMAEQLAPKGETAPAPAVEGMADVGQWAAAQIAMIGVSARAKAMILRRAERAAARAEGKRRKGQGGK